MIGDRIMYNRVVNRHDTIEVNRHKGQNHVQ